MHALHQVVTTPEVSRSTYSMQSIMEAVVILNNSLAERQANFPSVIIILCVLQPVAIPS